MSEDLNHSDCACGGACGGCASEGCASCAEYLAGWKRAQADYQNLKKETERERAVYIKSANERLLGSLLPLLDQLEMALVQAPAFDEPAEIAWAKGIQAIASGWEKVFQGLGLSRVSTEGTFDPLWHEAAGEEVVEGVPAGQIARVLQGGWRSEERVLRPARVIVTK